MLYFIYALVDPTTDIPGYVGLTTDPNVRYQQHLSCTDSNSKKATWIKTLRERGIGVKMRILEVVDNEEKARDGERHWIQSYISEGIALTNNHLTKSPQIFRPTFLPPIEISIHPKFTDFEVAGFPSKSADGVSLIMVGTHGFLNESSGRVWARCKLDRNRREHQGILTYISLLALPKKQTNESYPYLMLALYSASETVKVWCPTCGTHLGDFGTKDHQTMLSDMLSIREAFPGHPHTPFLPGALGLYT